jgi:hypothetical protein
MFRLFNKFQLFYSPDAPGGDGDVIPPAAGDKEDDIKFMGLEDEPNDDDAVDLLKDDKAPKKEEKKKETKDELDEEDDDEKPKDDDEEDDELEALVEELEEPDAEKLELTTPVRRREILKKYPNLFKDFPYLEKAYYREQQFTELLPTIDDAKIAVEKAETLDNFEKDLMGGNTETILKTIREQDPNSFMKIVDDYLPALARVDEKAYTHVLGNVSKHTIIAMVQEGRRSNNENLVSAAQILNQFVFGTSEFSQPDKLARDAPKDERGSELENEKKEFTRQKFESARGDLNTKLNNSLKSTIEANIDPRSSMSSYVKNNAIRDANEQLTQLITGDKRFGVIIDRLWKNAFDNNFTKESTDRIRSAYLSKAKTLLPSVIKKARIEALKGMGKRVRDTEINDDKNRPNKSEKSRSDKSDKNDKTTVPRGVRTLDFLNSDD